MSFANAEEARKHRNHYLIVFAALGVFTLVTVGVAQLDLPIPLAIAIALFVASIKGSLVACVFMHLLTERTVLYALLALCGLFFIVLLLLPVFTDTETLSRTLLQRH